MTKDLNNADLKWIHLGLEKTALWNSIALRLGVSANPANFQNTKVISGGIGLKIFDVDVDMAIIGSGDNTSEVELSGGFRG